ncbi:MAG: copper-binding protein [Dehalococcoidia bacterium]|nr:copper-binding protein [Dehalococcoidia bacterium]
MMRRMRLPLLLATLLLGALALAACGGGDKNEKPATTTATTAGGGTKTTVDVTLKEWAVEPSKAAVPTGNVTFKASNKGTIAHELMVVSTDLAVDKLAVKDAKADESKLKVIGEIEEFAAGKSAAKTFTLAKGKYLLLCNVATHYELGMRIAFTVE